MPDPSEANLPGVKAREPEPMPRAEPPRMPIGGLEMQEYLMSSGSADFAIRHAPLKNKITMTDHLREGLRFHRFMVMNWLLMNGAVIPGNLFADELHAGVGQQLPDRPRGKEH